MYLMWHVVLCEEVQWSSHTLGTCVLLYAIFFAIFFMVAGRWARTPAGVVISFFLLINSRDKNSITILEKEARGARIWRRDPSFLFSWGAPKPPLCLADGISYAQVFVGLYLWLRTGFKKWQSRHQEACSIASLTRCASWRLQYRRASTFAAMRGVMWCWCDVMCS